MKKNDQLLIILSGITASGKTTVGELITSMCSSLRKTVSCTTRQARQGEKDGVDYYFLEEDEFIAKSSNGEFIEFKEVHGYFYGTLRSELMKIWQKSKLPLLLIDVQGALYLKEEFPKSILFFIQPISMEFINERLRLRKGISTQEIATRLKTAEQEIAQAKLYDYIIDNPIGEPEKAARKIISICSKFFGF